MNRYRQWYEDAQAEIEELKATRITSLSARDVLDWLILQLPPDHQWTHVQRDNWLAAYGAILSMAIRVDDSPPAPQEEATP